MGLAKPGKTSGLTGTGQGLACQDAAGWVSGRFWNRTELFFRSKPGPLAGYPDPLLTLGWTCTPTRSDGPGLLLTLELPHNLRTLVQYLELCLSVDQ